MAQIAAGTTCGPNQDQSCLTQALGGIEGKSDVTQANFETVLADYFTAAVAKEPTTVATHSVNTGCPGGETTFAVPNPPSLCASFANWNCSSNTTGISVVWNDSGKGNLLADTSSFAGGTYSLTARLVIGSTTRERPLTGTFNIQAMSAAKAAGYRTGSQPGYWGNPYNPLHRARNQYSGWGGYACQICRDQGCEFRLRHHHLGQYEGDLPGRERQRRCPYRHEFERRAPAMFAVLQTGLEQHPQFLLQRQQRGQM